MTMKQYLRWLLFCTSFSVIGVLLLLSVLGVHFGISRIVALN